MKLPCRMKPDVQGPHCPRRLTVKRNANHYHTRRYQMPNHLHLRETAARVIWKLCAIILPSDCDGLQQPCRRSARQQRRLRNVTTSGRRIPDVVEMLAMADSLLRPGGFLPQAVWFGPDAAPPSAGLTAGLGWRGSEMGRWSRQTEPRVLLARGRKGSVREVICCCTGALFLEP